MSARPHLKSFIAGLAIILGAAPCGLIAQDRLEAPNSRYMVDVERYRFGNPNVANA